MRIEDSPGEWMGVWGEASYFVLEACLLRAHNWGDRNLFIYHVRGR